MKIVIPYKYFPGPELKYCLRGIEMFVPDAEIVIIGDKPPFQNITHIPFADSPDLMWKERNIFRKTLLMKEDFWFFNDDHFLLAGLPGYHYSGRLRELKESYSLSNSFRKTLQNTINVFGNIYNYFRHAPIYIEREKLESLTKLNWKLPWSYCLKSSYCFINGIEGEEYPDLKFRTHVSENNIRESIKGRPYFSTGDNAMNDSMVNVLESLYPNKSMYENNSCDSSL